MNELQERDLAPYNAPIDQSNPHPHSRSTLSLKAFLDETEAESQRWPYTSRERYYRSSAYLDATKSPSRPQSASEQSIQSPYAASLESPRSPIMKISDSKGCCSDEDKKCDRLRLHALTSTSTDPLLPPPLSISRDTSHVKEGKNWEADEGAENVGESEPLMSASPIPGPASPSDTSTQKKKQQCKGSCVGFRKLKEVVNARIEKVVDVAVQKLMQHFAPIFTANARGEMETEDVRPRLLMPPGCLKCDFDDYDAPSHDTDSSDIEKVKFKGTKKGKKQGKEA